VNSFFVNSECGRVVIVVVSVIVTEADVYKTQLKLLAENRGLQPFPSKGLIGQFTSSRGTMLSTNYMIGNAI
jgi:hypothetical protein